MATAPAFADLGDEKFVALTTFRKSGEPVSTPVWVGRDGDSLIVTTPEASGKVKRLRHSPLVELRACSRRGAVQDGVQPMAGVAEILTDAAGKDRLTGLIRAKYGVEFRLVMALERLFRTGETRRVILRITPA